MIRVRFRESEKFKKWNTSTVAENKRTMAAATFSSRGLAAAFSASNHKTSVGIVDMNFNEEIGALTLRIYETRNNISNQQTPKMGSVNVKCLLCRKKHEIKKWRGLLAFKLASASSVEKSMLSWVVLVVALSGRRRLQSIVQRSTLEWRL